MRDGREVGSHFWRSEETARAGVTGASFTQGWHRGSDNWWTKRAVVWLGRYWESGKGKEKVDK